VPFEKLGFFLFGGQCALKKSAAHTQVSYKKEINIEIFCPYNKGIKNL